MFDSFVPSSGNTWDKSFNSSFTSECGNAEPADAITPGLAINNIPASGASGEVIDIPPPAPASDFSLILLDTPLQAQADNTTSRHETQAVDALTRQALPAAVVEGAISSAHSALAELAAGPDFADKMNLAFGEGWDAAVAGDLAQDWLTGDFSELPPVEIRAGAEINGANGAFAGATNTIYLSSEFVAGNAGSPEAIASVLLEEMGHYIDSRINTSDAAGDEGAIFAGAVQGKEFDAAELQALKAEDDTATVMLDGQAILIEQDNTLSAARVITVGSTTTTYSDWVGTTDTNDYYRFSLSNNSNFNLTLNGLSADADVQLLNSSGTVLQTSSNGGTTADTISRSLNAGTYYVRVYPYGTASTNYNLSLSAATSAIPSVTASATPILSLNQPQNGSLSTTDRANPTRTGSFSDDYSLRGFSAGQQVQLNMSSTAFDSYLQLVNQSTGQVIQFDDDSGGNNNSRLTFTAQSGVNYLVRATSFGSGSTGSYSLSAAPVAPPPTVTISATDASAGETLSGQTANPGAFTVTRTGSTAAALTVNYSVAGTATKGTDYSNLTGSVTIAAGATSALVPINVIDDSLVEGNETATVTLAANTAYTVGSANTATLTIADNDPTTVPIALNQSLSGTLSTTDPNNPTRSGSYRDDYQLTGVSAGQQVRVSMNSSFDNYLQVVNAATGAVIAENDDANGTANAEVTFTVQSGVSYLLRATSYSGGVTGSYTISAAPAQTQIPATNWKAEYFNNINLTGTPVFVEDLGSGSQNFSRNWGNGAPTNTPSDNFSARMTTQRYLAPGLYQIQAQADDGVRVRLGNQTVIDKWVDQPFVKNSGYFRSNGGDVPVTVEYYERGGGAAINLSIAPAVKFQDSVNEQQWRATVYSWNSSQGSAPPTNFWEGDYNNPNTIGVINLGSNTRSDGKKGINANWGTGAPNGDSRLPSDNFAMRAYTWADFDGSPYKFRVRGDDGFQLLAKNHATGEWYNITAANQWTQAYGAHSEITYQLPAGRYDMHFHQYEAGGDAYLDLSWERAVPSLQSNPTESNPLRGFSHPLNGAGTLTRDRHGSSNDRSYYAVDWGANIGTPVYAMRSGTVLAVKENVRDLPADQDGPPANSTNVNYAVIKLDDNDGVDDNYRALYLHLQYNSVLVNPGDRVTAGQLIGYSGHNGWSEGPHLHAEIHKPSSSGGWGQTVPFQIG